MKTKHTLLFVFTILINLSIINAQNLYIPGGTGGIGTSSNSNVGIGTNTPEFKLTVKDNGSSFGIMPHINGIDFYTSGNFAPHYQTQFAIYKGVPGSGELKFLLNEDGNIGIGNINPGFKLDIQGWGLRLKNPSMSLNAYTTFRIQGGENLEHGLEIDFFGNPNFSNLEWTYGAGYGGAAILNVNPKPLVLGTSNLPRLLITGDGNILIGKTTQTASEIRFKLDVAGPIRADEIVVSTSGADFVFEPTYKLSTLSELETFIHTNKHLPGIASAKEMQENGVSSGEMHAKLLQKVEELTLYVIELKKENEELKTEKDSQLIEFQKSLKEQQKDLLQLKKELENLKQATNE